MPLLYVYDKTGNVVSTLTATSVGSSGTQATFPFPSTLTQSGYSLALVNQIGTGAGLAPAGDNLLSIASSQTISGSPFGVAAGGQSITTSTLTYEGDRWVGPTTSTTYKAVPVTSLYSNGQVMVGSVPVNVGANPTAIATYAEKSVTQVQDIANKVVTQEIITTTDGPTRAVVANSGSNTVSILDIANNVLLNTVTVGNQPVALAVSPDGTTAYVANYTDSTITEVNLSTGTPVTTLGVGGQPTSVALAAPNTLWVGGVGFLTEINTQNMSLVATQSTAGETIAALGFSDAENELIATTMNSGGGVNVDEINPSSVQPGTLYAAVASHPVSTLGTYFSPRTQAQVLGFTATIAQSSVPVSTNQVGAPPLVVQDGWAAVSATPTGFTITDASGHIVLVSETTPSPIAAIAVDSNLNVAYLTMPATNTLLTVPLPGTSGTNSTSGSFAVTATNNNPTQTALSLGHSMSYTINVAPVSGFTGAVALWIGGLPAGVTASLSTTSIATFGSATLTLTAAYSASTFIGSSTVLITGTSGGTAQPVAIPLTTQPLQYRGYCSVQ
jgi:YVTN family beta-propeller protein